MDKKEIRQSVIKKLKALTDKERNNIQLELHNHFIQSTLWKEANTIGVTVSQGFEWDTRKIIESAWEQGKTVVVPKCSAKEKVLTFYELTSFEQLEVVYYNLLEPKISETKPVEKQMIELLIVPGVVFQPNGYRIGFGGGFYDRFLADFTNETVSLVSTIQLKDDLPIEKHDIPVKHLITENGFIDG